MSWRQRAGDPTNFRPRQTNRPVYEDFNPKIDTNERQEARIVVLHVPGFVKEQMRITAEQSGNIRVQGQRPLLNNKWSRFNQLLPIPTSCEANKIHAKFNNGLLTITMPKETPKADKPVEKTTQENNSGSPPTKSIDGKVVPPVVVSEPPNKKAVEAAELRAQKGHEKTPQTASSVEKTGSEEHKVEKSRGGIPQTADLAAEREEKKIGSSPAPNPQKEKETGKPKGQKGEQTREQLDLADIPQKPSSTDQKAQKAEQTRKQIDLAELPQKPSSSTGPKPQKVQEVISSYSQSNEDKKKAHRETVKETEKGEKVVEKSSEEKTKEGIKKVVAGAANAKMPKDDNGDTLGIKYITETAKQAMSNVMKKLKEDDRQLLINIGAAVMVLVALGAYISFGNFGSSSTENEN